MAEFPQLDTHCEHPGCRQLDFLPFKCDGCSKTFCLDHRRTVDHKCEKNPIEAKSREAVVCPLCQQPLQAPKTNNPSEVNQIVEKHISAGCKNEQKERINKNKCSHPGCKTSELIPFKCSHCRNQFCIKHRQLESHNCPATKKDKMVQRGPFLVPIRVRS